MLIVINNSLPDVLVFSGNQGTIGMVGLIPQQCRFLIIVHIIFLNQVLFARSQHI
jgi:hypothetical protein